MYKFIDNQIRFEDFEQPQGMNIKRDNRWVKKAENIPWAEVEKKYATLFKNKKGNVAKPLRLALGACIIQSEYGYSDEETTYQIQENPYLQFFCGYKGYDDSKAPFDPSLMVSFRKRLTAEIIGEINELVIEKAMENTAQNDDKNNDNDSDDDDHNSGTMIIDATCAPSQIKYPQDTELLNEAREITEKIIDELHDKADGIKPRTYRKNARKDYLNITRMKKKPAKKIRKAVRKQLGYLNRNLNTIDKMLETKTLPKKYEKKLETIKKVYAQQKFMHDNSTHSVENRIVSISQPFLRPIVRGKAKATVEFGAKLDITVVDGYTRLETYSFEAYNESVFLTDSIERFKLRTGHYPERVLADKIYRNRDNLKYCAERGIHLSGPALGRPKKDEIRDKKQDYIDQAERVEVERKFSLAKRKCGLGLIVTKLENTVGHSIAMSVLLLNLKKVLCRFLHFFVFDGFKLIFFKTGFVQ